MMYEVKNRDGYLCYDYFYDFDEVLQFLDFSYDFNFIVLIYFELNSILFKSF